MKYCSLAASVCPFLLSRSSTIFITESVRQYLEHRPLSSPQSTGYLHPDLISLYVWSQIRNKDLLWLSRLLSVF